MAETEAIPRKRSKVLRACDACRRKKVRCDGEFSNTDNLVTKICTNCRKNSDRCTFSRVPLKRGPSKGYIRDLEEKLENSRPRKSSVSLNRNRSASALSMELNGITPQISSGVANGSGSSNASSNSPHGPTTPSSNGGLQNPLHMQPNLPLASQLPYLKPGSSNIVLPPLIGVLPPASRPKASPNLLLLLLLLLEPSGIMRNQINQTHTNQSTHLGQSGQPKQSSQSSQPAQSAQMSLMPLKLLAPLSPHSLLIHPPLVGPSAVLGATQAPHASPLGPVPQNKSPPIQGPFWKVPYEMPSSLTFRSSSVDLVLLSNLNVSVVPGQRLRLPSLKANILASDTAVSDSDEDFYSAKLLSQLISPRNSISSLLSLNGRINSNLTLNNSLHQHQQSAMKNLQPFPQQHPFYVNISPNFNAFKLLPVTSVPPQFLGPAIVNNSPMTNVMDPGSQFSPLKFPPHTIEQNLTIYYAKFHNNFPILPFNENLLKLLIERMILDDQLRCILDLFHLALSNLNNFHQHLVKDNINLLTRLMNIYPFHTFGYKFNDPILIFFFLTLVLINYSILLNGDIYSLAASITVTIFNDFKVLEKFTHNKPHPDTDKDAIELYLPKLYLCLLVIDLIYALSFGVQKAITLNPFITYLYANIDTLLPQVPETSPLQHGVQNLKLAHVLLQIINARRICDRNASGGLTLDERRKLYNSISWPTNVSNFPTHFLQLINEKLEVTQCVFEIEQILQDSSIQQNSEFSKETIKDYQFKLGRQVKKLSHQIVNLANYISTISIPPLDNLAVNVMIIQDSPSAGRSGPNAGKVSANSFELCTPLLNILYAQMYKLIKLLKLIVDLLLIDGDAELLSRCGKINNDLLIAFNLLKSNLNSQESQNNRSIGSLAIFLIKSKLELYDLKFSYAPPSGATNGNSSWRDQFKNTVIRFIEEENESWF